MNTDASIPFMQYLVTRDRDEFPLIDGPFADGEDPTVIRNASLEQALVWFPTWAADLDPHSTWKGAISEKGGSVVLFLEVPYVHVMEEPSLHWTIVDGILKGETGTLAHQVFTATPELHDLYADDGQPLPRPVLMMAAQYQDKTWTPVDTDRPVYLVHPRFSLGEQTFYLPVSVPVPLPVSVPVPLPVSVPVPLPLPSLFAVFTLQDKYILRPLESVSDEQLQEFFRGFQDLDIFSIYFNEGGVPVWCILAANNAIRLT
jgi:hypothetical protein